MLGILYRSDNFDKYNNIFDLIDIEIIITIEFNFDIAFTWKFSR